MGRGPFPLLRTRKPPNFPASVTSSSGRAGLVFVQVSLKKSYGIIQRRGVLRAPCQKRPNERKIADQCWVFSQKLFKGGGCDCWGRTPSGPPLLQCGEVRIGVSGPIFSNAGSSGKEGREKMEVADNVGRSIPNGASPSGPVGGWATCSGNSRI